LTSPPTAEELYEAVTHMRCGTACGLDGIPLEAFHKSAFRDDDHNTMQHPVLEAFLPIVAACIRLGRAPLRWRSVRLTSIYKKGDPTRCESYRPISVSMSAYRVFATFINHRFSKALEDSGVLHDGLYGFRPHRSPTQPPIILKHWVSTARSAGATLFAGFIDLKGAFDTVSHSALMKALECCGADPLTRGLIVIVIVNYSLSKVNTTTYRPIH